MSRLFSRPEPRGLSRDPGAGAVFDAFERVAPSSELLTRTKDLYTTICSTLAHFR